VWAHRLVQLMGEGEQSGGGVIWSGRGGKFDNI